MLYIIYQVDRPGSDAVRAANLAAHAAYLEQHSAKLVLGGALMADDGVGRRGSCLIVNVGTRKEAEAFSRDAPFSRAGVFESVRIRRFRRAHWNPAAAPRAFEDD